MNLRSLSLYGALLMTACDSNSGAEDDDNAVTGSANSLVRRELSVYVGGWDWSGAEYPYREYRLDPSSGALRALGDPIALGPNPSYAVADAKGRFLYIANEHPAKPGITVAAIQPDSSRLVPLEHEVWRAGDGEPVFTSIDPSGKWLLAASYSAGKVLVHRIAGDGTLSEAVDLESFGQDAQTHSVRVAPNGKFAYAPNKGLDNIGQFGFDDATGMLTPLPSGALATGGDGPRHIAFTPDGRFAFVSFELSNELGAYRVARDGTLTELERQSSLPSGVSVESVGAHVLVHPSGKFVYMSNRGHDSIAVFRISRDGCARLLQHAPTRGKTPRHFDIDHTGRLLVVANQGDDGAANGSLAVFAIAQDGRLESLADPVTGLEEPNSVTIVRRERSH